ncbi:MAG: right-handed parallel beta-helix repeat-containing protein [Candidatus Kariarchaeaceae archaeon]
MKVPIHRLILISASVLLLILSLISVSNPTNNVEYDNFSRTDLSSSGSRSEVSSLKLNVVYNTTYNELRIFGDAQLASYATSGLGTEGDPYILENYNVTSDGTETGEPLYLSSISAHAIIRNNIFDSQDIHERAGYVVVGSQNLIFENNTFMNAKVGLYVSTGSNIVIKNQNFVAIDGLSSRTIQLYRTTNVLIEDLEFSNLAGVGIYGGDATSTIIRNTTISGSNRGIEITRSGGGYGEDNIITNCTIDSLDGEGIIDWGYNNTIANSSFSLSNYGITLFHSTFTTIENNTFNKMVYNSIQYSTVSSSTTDHVIRNNIFANSTRGIVALNANVQNNLILNNTFTGNNYAIDWETTSAGSNNTIKFNTFTNNSNALYFGDYAGLNTTQNLIQHSRSNGISVFSTQNLWVKNNTIYNSSSHGLAVFSGTVSYPSEIMFNDFMQNGGTNSQVISYSPNNHMVGQNYYSDHSNIDADSDGVADSAYDFDNFGTYSDPTPLVDFSSPYSANAQAPVLSSSNSSTLYVEISSTGNILYWNNVTDNNPDTYTITLDGTPISGHDSQTWTSGQNFNISLDGLAIGSYQFKASFEDTFGNKLVSSITVNIVDQNAPTVTYNIVDFSTYNFGELTTFLWTGNDASPSNYSILLNDEPKINEIAWISGIEYDFDLSEVIVGLNKITLTLNDYAGNSKIRYIYFYIIEGEVPVIHEAPNSSIDIPENQSSFLVTYNATDDVSPSYYQIWINNVKQGSDITWVNSTDIVIDLVPYLTSVGNYNFTIIFYDGAGLSISHQIWITYGDLIYPSFTTTPSSSLNVEFGVSGYSIDIQATDANPNRFLIYLDDSEVLNETWNSGEIKTYSLPILAIGNHNVTFVLTDNNGNLISFEVSITVSDTLFPNLSSSPSDLSYIFGTTGNEISWTFEDPSAYYYFIERNGTMVVSNTNWISGIPITYSIDELAIGVYNYTIVVYDSEVGYTTDTVIVTVTDQTSNTNTVESSTISTSPPTSPSSSQPETSGSEKNSDSGENGFLPGFHLPLFFISFIGLISLYRIQRKHN